MQGIQSECAWLLVGNDKPNTTLCIIHSTISWLKNVEIDKNYKVWWLQGRGIEQFSTVSSCYLLLCVRPCTGARRSVTSMVQAAVQSGWTTCSVWAPRRRFTAASTTAGGITRIAVTPTTSPSPATVFPRWLGHPHTRRHARHFNASFPGESDLAGGLLIFLNKGIQHEVLQARCRSWRQPTETRWSSSFLHPICPAHSGVTRPFWVGVFDVGSHPPWLKPKSGFQAHTSDMSDWWSRSSRSSKTELEKQRAKETWRQLGQGRGAGHECWRQGRPERAAEVVLPCTSSLTRVEPRSKVQSVMWSRGLGLGLQTVSRPTADMWPCLGSSTKDVRTEREEVRHNADKSRRGRGVDYDCIFVDDTPCWYGALWTLTDYAASTQCTHYRRWITYWVNAECLTSISDVRVICIVPCAWTFVSLFLVLVSNTLCVSAAIAVVACL